MVDKDTPEGAVTRGLRIGKLAASLSGSYFGYQFQNLLQGGDEGGRRKLDYQKQVSRQVRRELQQLKGPVMKLGQMLSSQETLIPKEALEELSGLQLHAPPMHPTLARAQFRASFGKNPEEVFREFSATPFAAASLGQVHQAVTRKGEAVAVKIQYPCHQGRGEERLQASQSGDGRRWPEELFAQEHVGRTRIGHRQRNRLHS
jgi:predicted unusual protein kinase regulating ubiquinone biosynthesis (AarF/ABC1/UbiB family)